MGRVEDIQARGSDQVRLGRIEHNDDSSNQPEEGRVGAEEVEDRDEISHSSVDASAGA